MLKFISSNEINYEDALIKEFNIPSITKINDFISSLQPATIQTLLKQSAEKNDIRDTKKAEEFFRSKVLLLVSLFTNSKSFNDNTTRNAFNNLLQIISSLTGDNKFAYLSYLQDIYSLIPTNAILSADLKCELLLTVLNTINEDSMCASLYKANKERINELLKDFIAEDVDRVVKVYSALGKVLYKVKNFDILDKQDFKIIAKLLTPSVELVRIFFYVLFKKLHLSDMSSFYASIKNIIASGKEELSLSESERKIINCSTLQELREVDVNSLNEIYGNNLGEKFVINAKLRIVYQIFSKVNTGDISFDRLENEMQVNIEDLEETVFEADDLNLFKLVIDYERSVVRVRYVRRSSFDLDQMRGRVSGLRDKLKGMVKKIDLLMTSE